MCQKISPHITPPSPYNLNLAEEMWSSAPASRFNALCIQRGSSPYLSCIK